MSTYTDSVFYKNTHIARARCTTCGTISVDLPIVSGYPRAELKVECPHCEHVRWIGENVKHCDRGYWVSSEYVAMCTGCSAMRSSA